MAGLESLDETQPTGSGSLVDGDNAIRETRQKTKESVNLEHTLSGYHTIPVGTIVTRPAPDADHGGRIYFLETSDSNEIQVWNGSQWVNYTRNVETEENTADIAAHIASDPIAHANSSVTRDKLKSGLLAKKHFIDGSSDNGLVSGLVDGSSTTLHTHPAQAVNYPNSAINFTRKEVATGTANENKVCSNSISAYLSSVNAQGVILEAHGVASPTIEANLIELIPRVRIRDSSQPESEYMLLIGGYILSNNLYSGITKIGWKGQGMFPISSDKKFSYQVEDFTAWTITLVGYFV
jgi:hypothetical protein